jgi:vancomycin resistance protein YoaR
MTPDNRSPHNDQVWPPPAAGPGAPDGVDPPPPDGSQADGVSGTPAGGLPPASGGRDLPATGRDRSGTSGGVVFPRASADSDLPVAPSGRDGLNGPPGSASGDGPGTGDIWNRDPWPDTPGDGGTSFWPELPNPSAPLSGPDTPGRSDLPLRTGTHDHPDAAREGLPKRTGSGRRGSSGRGTSATGGAAEPPETGAGWPTPVGQLGSGPAADPDRRPMAWGDAEGGGWMTSGDAPLVSRPAPPGPGERTPPDERPAFFSETRADSGETRAGGPPSLDGDSGPHPDSSTRAHRRPGSGTPSGGRPASGDQPGISGWPSLDDDRSGPADATRARRRPGTDDEARSGGWPESGNETRAGGWPVLGLDPGPDSGFPSDDGFPGGNGPRGGSRSIPAGGPADLSGSGAPSATGRSGDPTVMSGSGGLSIASGPGGPAGSSGFGGDSGGYPESRFSGDGYSGGGRGDGDGPGEGSRKPKRRIPLIAGAAVAGVLVLAYAVPAVLMMGEVPPDTKVAGVDISGLSPQAAAARLEKELGPRAARPIKATAAGKQVQLKPSELGLSIDAEATVAAATDGALTPAGLFTSLFGSRTLEPVVKVDEAALNARVTELAKTVDRKPREAVITFAAFEPKIAAPKSGLSLDRAAAARDLRAAFLREGATVKLATKTLPPSVAADEVREVAKGKAREAVAGDFTLTSGARKATISRTDLAANLRFTGDGGSLKPSFDAEKLVRVLERQLVEASQLPRDASFKIVSGKPKIVPDRKGRGLDVAKLGQVVEAALEDGETTAAAPIKVTQARLTAKDAGKLGIKEQVSSYTTNHPCCAPRVTNIHAIADILDGYVVKPGETFSVNTVVGKRDKARGFVEAPMILNGRFVNDVGGGVSQFVTTMFNAMFFGGYQDVQHMAHMYYISRYPAGRESTVSFPQPDFRWKNDSKHGVLIKTSYTSTSITVQFWGTKRYEIESESSSRYNVKSFTSLTESGPKCQPMPGAEGFTIDVFRVFKKDGKVLRKQKFTTVYQPEPRLTCEKKEEQD